MQPTRSRLPIFLTSPSPKNREVHGHGREQAARPRSSAGHSVKSPGVVPQRRLVPLPNDVCAKPDGRAEVPRSCYGVSSPNACWQQRAARLNLALTLLSAAPRTWAKPTEVRHFAARGGSHSKKLGVTTARSPIFPTTSPHQPFFARKPCFHPHATSMSSCSSFPFSLNANPLPAL